MSKIYTNTGSFGVILQQPDFIYCNFCATVAADVEVIRKVLGDKWWHKIILKTVDEQDQQFEREISDLSEEDKDKLRRGRDAMRSSKEPVYAHTCPNCWPQVKELFEEVDWNIDKPNTPSPPSDSTLSTIRGAFGF